jgi:hypothetical protein
VLESDGRITLNGIVLGSWSASGNGIRVTVSAGTSSVSETCSPAAAGSSGGVQFTAADAG